MGKRVALFALCSLMLCSCSEARSDIENLEAKVLEDEAKSLAESADAATQEQVKQIQPMAIETLEKTEGEANNN